jgi:agmatine deiminase
VKERLRLPAEWEPHTACWIGFPHLEDEWPSNLPDAQRSVAALCRSIAEAGNEQVNLLVQSDRLEERARSLIGDLRNVEYVQTDYGDCWLRDTAPLFGHSSNGTLGALCFRFNGWGGKYVMPSDERVSGWLTERLGAARFECDLILEGGALESNGSGALLTTASCTLNENRNPGLTRDSFEESLAELVSVERLVWLERGLEHDHTDGHIDMIARFVSTGTVASMRSRPGAPNAGALESIERQLRASGFEVLSLPAPPAVKAPDGSPLPASYCNFYIANEAVIVPTYQVAEDELAIGELANAFPRREVVGLPARDLLWGGGVFHCVTQAQPAGP